MKKIKIEDDKLINAIENNESMLKACESLGLAFSTFKRKATKLGLYKTNQGRKNVLGYKNRGGVPPVPLKEILNGLHPKYSTGKLKKRLIKDGIKKEICEECGQGPIWNNQRLVLQLDHQDGNRYNHKLKNLKLLCPNCHTQTPTYCGRNLKKK